jgi:general secretion pathway protein E
MDLAAEDRAAPPTLEERLRQIGALADAPPGTQGRGGYRALSERTTLDPAGFAAEVAAFHHLPHASADAMLAGRSLVHKFSPRFLRQFAIYPYESPDGTLRFALADPSDEAALRAMELSLGRPAVREVAPFDVIATALQRALGSGEAAEADELAVAQAEQPAAGSDDDLDNLRDLASGAQVVRALTDLFERAVEFGATDVHIEPARGGLQVRMRVDGLLRRVAAPPGDIARALVSRVKILAGLNIAERRLPQDGRVRVRVGSAEIDVRVATMPTTHGEAAILRLLERNHRLLNFQRLGFDERDRTEVERQLEAPHGLIVVTGPTGSGKTTTLAAAMARLNAPSRKILTIEDPIEYEISGVNQSQVKPAVGLTFATALRAFLRQDPDVIMVGEMRDRETASVGIQASLTGHLVLTTLHTNTAAAAITRLVDLGIEPFLLASTLRCLVGQRLVRVLCADCRAVAAVDRAAFEREPAISALGLKIGDRVAQAAGCGRCGGTGYRGRQGVFEVLVLNDDVRQLVMRGAGDAEIEHVAREGGMTTMIEDGARKVLAGVTSVDEVLRVTVRFR